MSVHILQAPRRKIWKHEFTPPSMQVIVKIRNQTREDMIYLFTQLNDGLRGRGLRFAKFTTFTNQI